MKTINQYFQFAMLKRSITTLFALVVLTVPVLTHAQSISMTQAVARMNEIIAEMERLRDEFRQLSSSVGQTTPTPSVLGAQTSSGPVFTLPLVFGETNDDIKRIQKLLATDSEIYPYGVASGFFGPKTEEAIKNLQARQGWETPGVVGPSTKELLEAYFKAYPDENWPTDVLKSKPPAPKVLGASTNSTSQQLADAMQALRDAQAKQTNTSSSGNPAETIEAELDRGEAKVKISYKNGNKNTILVSGDDEDEVIESIAARTVLTEAQVREVIDFDGDSSSSRSDGDEGDAEDAIDDADEAIDDADDEIEEADEDGEDVDWAEDTLDKAKDKLKDAEDAYEDEDWDEAIELAEEAEELAKEAEDRIGEEEDDEDTSSKGDKDEIEEIIAYVDEDESEIRVKYEDDDDYEFEIEEDKEDEIIEEVADELNLDEDEVEDLIEFRYGDIDSIDVLIDKEEEEARVTVDFESGVTLRFTVNETDEDEIIEAIAKRLDEDEDDIEDAAKFE